MQTIRQYDVFILAKDLNILITEGMQGVILEMCDSNEFLTEYVREDGINYKYEVEAMFTVYRSFIGAIIWMNPK
jgi:hypothetical protein